MLILVEGADGSGKTTLVTQLKQRGYKVISSVDRSLSSQDMRWKFAALHSCETAMKHCIMDRSFISELVYRTFDGEKPVISLSAMCNTLKFCKIILCETDTQYEDSIRRGEDNIISREQADKIQELYNFYVNMFEKFDGVPVYRYNWKKNTVADVSSFIKKPLKRR